MGTIIKIAAVIALTMILGISGPGQIREGVIPDESSDKNEAVILPGIWQTASMGYDVDGTVQPEYYVEFTRSDILYGHMKDGKFLVDHSDAIRYLEESASGIIKVQAEADNGVRYTYQTSESDEDILEYYETWDEDEFSEKYSGGASLSSTGKIGDDRVRDTEEG